MQFSIEREALLKPLQKVAAAVEKRQTRPILSHLHLAVKHQLLLLTGTDLEIELVARVPLSEPAEEGALTIPARKFIDICKALPEGLINVKKESEHKALVKSGRGRYVLASFDANEFPKLEDAPGLVELSVSSKDLKTLFEQTSFAMGHQDVRYYLNGLWLEFNSPYIRAVATDGHRLATYALPLKTHLEQPMSLILPRKGVLDLERLFLEEEEEVGVVIGRAHMRAITTRYSFTTKLIEGKFPNYKSVFPTHPKISAVMDKEPLKNALTRASVLFSEKYRGTWIHLSNGLAVIKASNKEKDEVEEELEVEYEGDTIEIGFNSTYLIDYLNVCNDSKIKMSLNQTNEGILLKGLDDENGAYVVMPLRI